MALTYDKPHGGTSAQIGVPLGLMMKIAASSFATDDGTKGRLQDLARHILDERDRRQWYFPRIFFDEMPWQILLILYVSETGRLSSDSLWRSLLAQPSTGNRWIDYLESEELVTRHVEPSDKSRSMVELAPKGIGLLDLYLSDRLQRGEIRTRSRQEASRSRLARGDIGMLVIAALSAGSSYLLAPFGALTRLRRRN